MNTPNTELRQVAAEYCASVGLPAPIQGHNVAVDQTRAEHIACAYSKLAVHGGRSTWRAYVQMIAEVEAQYRWLLDHGYTFTFTDGDPYPDSAAMCADVRENKHLNVYRGGDPHPCFSPRENEIFRAVHDIFGHAAEGYQFGPRGEENAWVHHSMMFSPLAQRALTTETRGQNSWVNYGPHSTLPVRDRPYARQKANLLPAWACDWRKALNTATR